MKKREVLSESARLGRNKRIILTVVASLILLVLLSGAVIGVIAFVRDKNALFKYEGVVVDGGVCHYLSATYKTKFLTEHGISDDNEIWEKTKAGSDKTYGDMLSEGCEKYIRGVVVGAYLFDRYSSLTREESDAIDKACEEILNYRADGNKDTFSDEAGKMGFDYRDMCRAVELLYKSERAKTVIYGYEGEALKDAARLAECQEYYGQYERVKVLYIPTKLDLMTDDNGNLQVDSEGKYITREFSSSEISERIADIEEIRALIAAIELSGEVQMTPTYFDNMQRKYNYDRNLEKNYIDSGYYFSPASEYREKFAYYSSIRLPGEYKDAFARNREWVIESAFDMNVGEYREYVDDYGVTFVYKCARADMAYAYASVVDMFHDFFSDAGDYLYSAAVDAIIDGVDVRAGFGEIDLRTLPYNYVYVPKVEV